MTINQLENFITVVEAGSFSQAAEKLFLSPQALIQKIARMEQELGFKLLLRTNKGVRVSPAGEEYYRSVKKALSEYSRGIDRAQKKAQASLTLRIGLPECVAPAYLLSVCRAFSERYPHVTLSYNTYSRTDTVKALLTDAIDIGAQIRPEENTPYFSERMFAAKHFCLVTRDSPLAQKSTLDLSDLSDHTVGYCGAVSHFRELSERLYQPGLNIQLRNVPEDFSEALVFCMGGGVLIATVPLISYLKSSLQVIPFSVDLGFSYYLSYTKQDHELIKQFIEVAREAAASDNHPWKLTLQNFAIDK